MKVTDVIKKILGRKLEKDTGKNLERGAYTEHDIIYSPFHPYSDQYTPGRHPVGINIQQKRVK
jgi:hypothetical protein